MPEFLLELFSEEIPARMQARAAEELCAAAAEGAGAADDRARRATFHGPRRLGLPWASCAERA